MEYPVTVDDDNIWIEKDKDASRVYRLDVSHLLSGGDSLVEAIWNVLPENGVTSSESSVAGTTLAVRLAGGAARKWYAATCQFTTARGDIDSFTIRVFVKEDPEVGVTMGSPLFPNKFAAVQRLRSDRLMLMAKAALPKMEASFDYLWGKLQAAEAEVGHELRVPLAPTRFFPAQPTPDQIEALDGAPWGIDPGYDYDGSSFQPDRWGMIKLRNKPLISVESVQFAYPGVGMTPYELPLSWLQIDRKYAMIQFVPNGSPAGAAIQVNSYALQAMGSGRVIPLALRLEYVAGLQDVETKYPDLLDAVYKTAALKIIEDAFLPSSGSISADGLSQSISFESEKHGDAIQRILHGAKGANGGLMAAIHGIRFGVMGG